MAALAVIEHPAERVTSRKELAARLFDLTQVQKTVTIKQISREVPYSRTTISKFISGMYKGNEKGVEEQLAKWYADYTGTEVDIPLEAPPEGRAAGRGRFYASRDAKAVLGVCQSCQEYGEMGIVTGRSGYGKTYALRRYAKSPKAAYIECDATMSPRDLLKELEKALGLPSRNGTNHDRVAGIVEFLTVNPGWLLIVDEADKLMSRYTYNKMEILRSIFDHCCEDGYSSCGIVVAGEPGLEAQIETYLDRYANRTIFRTKLGGLSEAEVEEYLSDRTVEPEALAELKARALNKRTGCFRLLDRTLRNVGRVLESGGGEAITAKALAQASSMMML